MNEFFPGGRNVKAKISNRQEVAANLRRAKSGVGAIDFVQSQAQKVILIHQVHVHVAVTIQTRMNPTVMGIRPLNSFQPLLRAKWS